MSWCWGTRQAGGACPPRGAFTRLLGDGVHPWTSSRQSLHIPSLGDRPSILGGGRSKAPHFIKQERSRLQGTLLKRRLQDEALKYPECTACTACCHSGGDAPGKGPHFSSSFQGKQLGAEHHAIRGSGVQAPGSGCVLRPVSGGRGGEEGEGIGWGWGERGG